jgi:dienelactone hydrolase
MFKRTAEPSIPGKQSRTVFRRLIKGFAILVTLVALGIAALLALLWREHRTEITLPALTGHFTVGRTSYSWVNGAQVDDLAPSSGVKREVVVWIWYPSAGSEYVAPAEYLPSPWHEPRARSAGALLSQFLTRDPAVVHVHGSSDPGISPEQNAYPVVIMRPGGSALTTDFTTLAEDLASHGYVVVGFDAPYRSGVVVFPDGRVVLRSPAANTDDLSAAGGQELFVKRILPMWIGDAQFVVDQLDRLNAAPSGRFKQRLDMRRLGIFGHSFGGATALQFCHDDSRCKAGIDLDGEPLGSVIKEGLTQPFLFLLSDHGDLSAPEPHKVIADMESIYDRLPNGRLLVFIRGANHFSFSDQILLKSQYFIGALQRLQKGGLDAGRGLRITTDYVHTFFDVYLKGAPASLMDNVRRTYPEVQAVPR